MKINKPYVSVVMTSFNRVKYISQAIDSILAQKCNFSYEILIGDNCSEDGTRDVLKTYKEKYPHIFVLNFQKENWGVGPNWASTCKLAQGKYMAFLDDDDYWCEDSRLQEMVDYLDIHDECGLVYTNLWKLNITDNSRKLGCTKLPEDEDKLDIMLHKSYKIPLGVVMLRKELLDKYIDLDAYIRLRFTLQDYPTVVLLAPHCEFHYMDKPTLMYRMSPGSISRPTTYEDVLNRMERGRAMMKYLYSQTGQIFDELGYNRYTYTLLLNIAYERGDYNKAKEYVENVSGYSLKRICTASWLSFHLYRVAKKIRRSVCKH